MREQLAPKLLGYARSCRLGLLEALYGIERLRRHPNDRVLAETLRERFADAAEDCDSPLIELEAMKART